MPVELLRPLEDLSENKRNLEPYHVVTKWFVCNHFNSFHNIPPKFVRQLSMDVHKERFETLEEANKYAIEICEKHPPLEDKSIVYYKFEEPSKQLIEIEVREIRETVLWRK